MLTKILTPRVNAQPVAFRAKASGNLVLIHPRGGRNSLIWSNRVTEPTDVSVETLLADPTGWEPIYEGDKIEVTF
jgi:hypothetical protein